MYLLVKFGDHRSHRNGDINSCIESYMDTLERAKITASIRLTARFLKSGIKIYNSEVPDTTGIKTRRRRKTQVIAKRFAFLENKSITLNTQTILMKLAKIQKRMQELVKSLAWNFLQKYLTAFTFAKSIIIFLYGAAKRISSEFLERYWHLVSALQTHHVYSTQFQRGIHVVWLQGEFYTFVITI